MRRCVTINVMRILQKKSNEVYSITLINNRTTFMYEQNSYYIVYLLYLRKQAKKTINYS